MHRGQNVSYIEVTLDDIETANRLAHEVLGRSLDELPPQTRRLLLLIDGMREAECERLKMERATSALAAATCARGRRGATRVLKMHLHGWKSWNICWCIAAAAARASFTSCCSMARATNGKPGLPGLIDVDSFTTTTERSRPLREEKSPPRRPQVGGVSRGSRAHETRANNDRPPNGIFCAKTRKQH